MDESPDCPLSHTSVAERGARPGGLCLLILKKSLTTPTQQLFSAIAQLTDDFSGGLCFSSGLDFRSGLCFHAGRNIRPIG